MPTVKESNQLVFNLYEQRYVASCYPLPDRDGIEECLYWKGVFADFVAKRQEQAWVAISKLSRPFPHLARLGVQGYFEKVPIQNYFEGLSEGSHNLNLYLFGVNLGRKIKSMPVETRRQVLLPVLDHVNGCAAKPANLETNQVWTYKSVESARFDEELIDTGSRPSLGDRSWLKRGQAPDHSPLKPE
jgi:hypothetical protein